MAKVLDRLDDVRDATRLLHQRLETAKDHAAIRGDLQTVASAAHELGGSLQTLAKVQRSDAKNHLDHAATLLLSAARTAKTAAAPDNDPKLLRATLRKGVRSALQSISFAVAAQRAASSKQRT